MHSVVESNEEIGAPLLERTYQFMQNQRRKRNRKEFWLYDQFHGYGIKSVMLDLESDVNILPNKSWESNGFPLPLIYSHIQLRMVNQHCIFPIRWMDNVEVDLVGVKTFTDLKLIEIMGGVIPRNHF